MPRVNFHDVIDGQQIGVLAAEYTSGDPTITLATSLPTHIVSKGPTVDLKCDGQLFLGTAFSVGNTVIDVTPDPQTADVTHLVGTPVYLVVAASTMEAFRDLPFVTDGDQSAELPNSVDVAGLVATPAAHAATHEDGGSDEIEVSEPMLALTDILTADASTAKHGLLPKLSGDPDDGLRGDGSWGAVATAGHWEVLTLDGDPLWVVDGEGYKQWLYSFVSD